MIRFISKVTATAIEPITTQFVDKHSTICSHFSFNLQSTICSHFSFRTSHFAPVSSKEFLDIQATIEYEFTLICVCYMIRTDCPIHNYF